MGIFIIFFDVFFGLFLCSLGVVFSIVSLVRHEADADYALLAMGLNGVPILLLLLNRNMQIIGP